MATYPKFYILGEAAGDKEERREGERRKGKEEGKKMR